MVTNSMIRLSNKKYLSTLIDDDSSIEIRVWKRELSSLDEFSHLSPEKSIYNATIWKNMHKNPLDIVKSMITEFDLKV